VPEEISQEGIGSMPPPGTGYDLAESVYMENLLKGQRNKEQQKQQAEVRQTCMQNSMHTS
jgi:hypothetical protein